MNTANDLKIIDITDSRELLNYWDEISSLFTESFGQTIDRETWEWAYISNPYGEPVVSLAISGERIVGHYAVIPLRLKNSTQEFNGYLSMTTMVASDFRRYGLFKSLAERVYNKLSENGQPAVVFGFPNDNSAPGFIKRLGWTIRENYSVVKLKPHQVKDAQAVLENTFKSNCYKIDLDNSEARKWRLNKPNQSWSIVDGLGIKISEHGRDLMYIENFEYFETCIGDQDINLILPVGKDTEYEVLFQYRFGYRVFNCDHEPDFIVEMCLSDVF